MILFMSPDAWQFATTVAGVLIPSLVAWRANRNASASREHAKQAEINSRPVSNGFTAHTGADLTYIRNTLSDVDERTRATDQLVRHHITYHGTRLESEIS